MSQNPSRILKISCPSSTSLQAEMRLNTISTAPSPQAFVVAVSFSEYPICHGETTSQHPNRTFAQSCHRAIIQALCVIVFPRQAMALWPARESLCFRRAVQGRFQARGPRRLEFPARGSQLGGEDRVRVQAAHDRGADHAARLDVALPVHAADDAALPVGGSAGGGGSAGPGAGGPAPGPPPAPPASTSLFQCTPQTTRLCPNASPRARMASTRSGAISASTSAQAHPI